MSDIQLKNLTKRWGSFTGLKWTVKDEQGTAAVKQTVCFPARIVFDRKHVIGSTERSLGLTNFKAGLS